MIVSLISADDSAFLGEYIMNDIKPDFNEGISISEEITQEVATKGISIAESISQTLELKRNGASQSVSHNIDLKIGDNTSFSTNDTTTFDATAIGSSIEKSVNATASYDNGVIQRSISAESSVKAGVPSSVEAKGKISHEMGNKFISIADSISGHAKSGLTESSIGVSHDTNVKVGKNVTFTGSDSTSAQANLNDASISRNISVAAKYENDYIEDQLSANAKQELSLNDGYTLSNGVEHQSGIKNVASVSQGVNQSMNFDGEKSSYTVEGNQKVKLGNDNVNVEQNSKMSTGVDSEGNVNYGGEMGVQKKVGGIETGTSVYANKSVGDDKESEDVGIKTKTGAQVSKGAKVTNETKVNSHHSSEFNSDENKTTYEDGADVTSKTRIEVDPQNASPIEIIAATIFNTQAAITESVMNEAMSYRDKTEVNHGEDNDAAESEAEEKLKEAQEETEKAEQELEQAQRELEESARELEKAQKELLEAQEELNEAKEENEKAIAEAEEAKQEYEEKQQAAEEAAATAEQSGEEADQKKAEEAQAEAEKAQENYEEKQNDVTKTQEKVQDAEHGVEAAESNLSEKVVDYGEKADNVMECQANYAEAQQRVREAEQAVEYARGMSQ